MKGYRLARACPLSHVNRLNALDTAKQGLRIRLGLLVAALCVAATTAFVPLALRPAGAESVSAAPTARVTVVGPNSWSVSTSLFDLATVTVPFGVSTPISFNLPPGLSARGLAGTSDVAARSGALFGIAGELPVDLPTGAGLVSLDLPQLQSDGSGTSTFLLEAADRTSTQEVHQAPNQTAVQAELSDSCAPVTPVILTGLKISVTGDFLQPTTFAEFFPAVLDRLVIRLDRRDAAEQRTAQAVLDLADFAARKWPHARVVVSDRPVQLSPFDRLVQFRSTAPAGLSLAGGSDGATLVIGGPAEKRPGLVSFVTSPLFEASFRSVANPGPVDATTKEHQPYVTVAELRGGGISAAGGGSASVSIAVDQSLLGGQMEIITASVRGVARTDGAGLVTVQLRANDRILATQRLGSDELFSLSGSLSAPSLAADNVFEVRVTDLRTAGQSASGTKNITSARGAAGTPAASGSATACGPGFVPAEVSLDLDPASSFEGTRGLGVPAGFDRFPQAFAGGFDIRFESLAFDDLVAAASMLELLQGRTEHRLVGRVTTGPAAVTSFARPTLFVAARGSAAASLAALGVVDGVFADEPGDTSDSAVGSATSAGSVSVVPSKGSAALSAVEQSVGDHLLLAADTGFGVSRLLAGTLADRKGFRSLRGDLLIESDGHVKNLRIRSTALVEAVQPIVVSGTRVRLPTSLGFTLGGVVAIVVVVTRRWRRS